MSIEEIFGHSINSVKELRDGIKELQNSIAGADATSEDFAETQEKIVAAQAQLNAVTKGTASANNAATDSIVGMEQEYKKLYNTYKLLTEEQRNSSFGKETAKQLDELSKKLNDTKMQVGNFKDNIGHYSEGVIDAFGKMGISMGALQKPMTLIIDILQNGGAGIIEKLNGVSDTLKKLKTGTTNITQVNQTLNQTTQNISSVTNVTKAASGGIGGMAKALGGLVKAAGPIMIVVGAFMALKAIVDGVRQAIQNNEESQMALKQAMANFQPIIDGVKNAFDALGKVVVKFVGWIGDATTAVRKFFSSAEGKKAIEEQVELYNGLEKSQQTLIKQKREYQKLNAKDQAEVERLREEASELENGKEKRRLLNEAKEKQAEIDARNVEIAKEELRILTEQSNLTANSAEDNEKLAAAEAKVAQEEANAARNARTFNKALKSTTSGANDAAAAANKLAEEAKKVYEATVENSKDELTKLEEKYKKEKELLEKYGYDTTLLTKQYEANRTDIFKQEWEKRINAIKENAKTTRDYETWLQGISNPKQGEAEKAWLQAENDYAKYKQLVKEVSDNIDFLSDEGQMDKKLAYFEAIIGKANELGIELKFPPADDEEPWKSRVGKFLISMVTIRQNFKDEVEELNRIATEEAVDPGVALGAKLKANQDAYMEALKGSQDKFIVTTAEGDAEYLKLEADTIQKILDTYEISTKKRTELEYALYEIKKQLREQEWAEEQIMFETRIGYWEEFFDTIQTGGDAVNTVLSSIKSRKEAEIEADRKQNKISEETAKKRKEALLKYEQTMQAVEIASVVANTAAGIMGVWKAYALEKVANAETAAATGPAAAATLAALNTKSLISAIVQTASLTATGAAQIASIRNGFLATKATMEADAAQSSTGTAATPIPIESEPYSYARTLQTQEDVDELQARPVWVSVEDISSGLNKVQVRDSEATF